MQWPSLRTALTWAFPLLLFTSNAMWEATAAVTLPVKQYYNLSNDTIANLPTLAFSVLYLAIGPFASIITRRFGLVSTQVASAVMMVVANVVRMLAVSAGFASFVVGTALAALVQPLFFANITTVAVYCQPYERQALYMGSVNTFSAIGTGVGFLFSTYLITDAQTFGSQNARTEAVYLGLDAAALLLVGGSLLQLWLRTLGRRAGAAPDAAEPCPSRDDRVAIVLCVGLASVLGGVSNAVTVLLEQLLVDRGNSNAAISVSGMLFLFPGIPMPYIAGWCISLAQRRRSLAHGTFVFFAITTALQFTVLVRGQLRFSL